jgi:hypothetical protein
MPPYPQRNNLSTGAIIGIAIGGAAALIIVAVVWFSVSKRVRQRRQDRSQSQMSQAPPYANWPSMTSPHPSTTGPGSPQSLGPPPSELDGRQRWSQKTDQPFTGASSPVHLPVIGSPASAGVAI